MTLTEIVNNAKATFYDLIFQGATAFPLSNDLMHAGIIGSMPFLAGKYGAEFLGNYMPLLKKHSTAAGYTASAISEVLWQTLIEPGSRYAYINPLRNARGMAETAAGAGLAHLATKLIK